MSKYAAMLALFISIAVGAGQSLAADPLMGADAQDDELGIGEEEPKADAKKKPVTKEDLPPIKMVLVKGGCFKMGDTTGNGDEDERPAHDVCVGDFYMSETEVTQELFMAVYGGLPHWRFNKKVPDDPKLPVNYLSWDHVQKFIKKLNEITKGYYRLPTEAEWEYAARSGGKEELWPGTNNEAEMGDYAWFSDNTDTMIMPVKSRKPNALGLYDMSGNVWEWVEDNFDFDFYQKSPKHNPFGDQPSLFRSVRGGSIVDSPYKLRTTYRFGLEHSKRQLNLGFRLAE